MTTKAKITVVCNILWKSVLTNYHNWEFVSNGTYVRFLQWYQLLIHVITIVYPSSSSSSAMKSIWTYYHGWSGTGSGAYSLATFQIKNTDIYCNSYSTLICYELSSASRIALRSSLIYVSTQNDHVYCGILAIWFWWDSVVHTVFPYTSESHQGYLSARCSQHIDCVCDASTSPTKNYSPA